VFGAQAVLRGAQDLGTATPLMLLAAITAGSAAILPFAAAYALRANLR
jgi:heme exporter protein B